MSGTITDARKEAIKQFLADSHAHHSDVGDNGPDENLMLELTDAPAIRGKLEQASIEFRHDTRLDSLETLLSVAGVHGAEIHPGLYMDPPGVEPGKTRREHVEPLEREMARCPIIRERLIALAPFVTVL